MYVKNCSLFPVYKKKKKKNQTLRNIVGGG